MKADHRVWVLVLAVTTWVSAARADPVALPRTGEVVTYGAGDDGAVRAGLDWPEPRFNVTGDRVVDLLTGSSEPD